MMKRPLFVLAALSLSAGVGIVCAQSKTTIVTTVDGKVVDVTQVDRPVDDPAFNTFAESDTNQDGLVDPQEAHSAGILTFSVADLNGDGSLDEAEYDAVASGETKLPRVEQ